MRLLTDPLCVAIAAELLILALVIATIGALAAHPSLPSCVIVLHPAYAFPERVVAEVRVGGQHSFWCGVKETSQ